MKSLATLAFLFAATAGASLAGPLSGANGHTASGSAMIENGKVALGSDFWFDGGPDVYVAVAREGKIQLLDKLRANSGAQTYALPGGAAGAEAILLFCKKYNVTLGRAPVE